jgi:Fe-Mn family superoxide dismutase
MSTEASGMSGGNMQGAYGVSNRNFGAFGPYSSPQAHLAPGAADVVPILCVNTWQHVWLRDWGVAGKEGFLEAWWRRINWEVVAQKLSQVDRHTVSTSSRQGQRQLF